MRVSAYILAGFTICAGLPIWAECESGLRLLRGGDTYSNADYSFHVTLPNDVEACATLPPSPDHGLRVVLRDKASLIWIDASYNSLGYRSSAAAADAALYSVLSSNVLIRKTSVPARLDGAAATRSLVRYRVSATGSEMVDERIVVLRGAHLPEDTGVLYTVGLTAPPSTYPQLARRLAAMLRGFSFEKPHRAA